ncbi:MAG: hypothetical protein QW608_00220, partial [Thermoplasmata archaeon]
FTQSEKSEPYNQYDTEESTNEEEEWVYNQYDTEESTNEEEEWVYNQYGTEESTNEEKGGTYNQYVAENVIYTLQRSDWEIILYMVLIGVEFLFLAVYIRPAVLLFYPIALFYIFHKTNIWQTEKRFKMGTIAIGIYSLTLFIISLIASNIIESIIKALGLFIMNEIFFVIIIYVANEIRRGR